ncbi:MAG TPA: hypothetical protein IAB56_06820 [Candidatus Scybalousia intestinigallinarum]|nr:hypothetical protein [Candidatus Scybalousia intestinigallinarum]
MEPKTKKKISRLMITPVLVIISGIIGYNIGLNKENEEKTLLEGSLQKSFYTEINENPVIIKSKGMFSTSYIDVFTNAEYLKTDLTEEEIVPIYQEIPADILFLPDNQEGKKELVKYLQEKDVQ